jgi:hypothetical protein
MMCNIYNILVVVLAMCGLAKAQLVDDFTCPDEFEGYYPHLFSCDKYWKCIEGRVTLEICGNGLAFDDLDRTFTTENCDYIHNVECGNRTELEPPITAPNCPRLYGTFPDPEDCTGFYNCRDGLANRYSCAPGLAYDTTDQVCKWADQVTRCKKLMDKAEVEGLFTCPANPVLGIYSKHAHPEDCRQYFVCISGTPREYGCPIGSVFKITQDGSDGICTDPADVPECSNYYGDLAFDAQELVKAGVDPEAVGIKVRGQSPSRVINSFTEIQHSDDDDFVQEVLKPIIEAAQAPVRVAPTIPRPRNNRPRPQATTTATTTTTTTTFAPLAALANDDESKGKKSPAVVKAGEDYYYYYYYYDDDEEAAEAAEA